VPIPEIVINSGHAAKRTAVSVVDRSWSPWIDSRQLPVKNYVSSMIICPGFSRTVLYFRDLSWT